MLCLKNTMEKYESPDSGFRSPKIQLTRILTCFFAERYYWIGFLCCKINDEFTLYKTFSILFFITP